MFAHAGIRALWPAVFFLPWFSLGIAYLGGSLRHRRWRSLSLPLKTPSTDSTFKRGSRFINSIRLDAGRLRVIGLAVLLTAVSLALADPVPDAPQPCQVSTQERARTLGDELFEQGAYQRAGECYQAAKEYDLANRAFLRAVQAESVATARQLSDQRDQGRTMLRRVQQAFRPGH
jgi:hypothetical protein